MGARSHGWRVYAYGDPDAMRWESSPIGEPVPGQVLVRHTAVGLSCLDLEQRRGKRTLSLPGVLGVQAAGVLESAPGGLSGLHIGDRVAYVGSGIGTYSEARLVSNHRLIRVPDRVPECIAGCMLDWLMTAYLLRSIAPIRRRDRVLIVEAGNSLGINLCLWLHAIGAEVHATTSMNRKQFEEQSGAHLIDQDGPISTSLQRAAANGAFAAVFDLNGSAESCAAISKLVKAGSRLCLTDQSISFDSGASGTLLLSRTSLIDEVASQPMLRELSADVFDIAARVSPRNQQLYPLNRARTAHEDYERNGYTGIAVMLP